MYYLFRQVVQYKKKESEFTRLRSIIMHVSIRMRGIKFLRYLHWRPERNSTIQLGTQNEGNCPSFIIKLMMAM